jgi:RHS repeat-associated protein
VRTLSYDDASRIISCNTPYTFINFTYDLDDTLTSQEEWTSFFSDNTHRTITYTYDADGNRASAALPGTTTLGYTYTGRNQLKAVTAGIGGASFVDYIYDKNGNPTSRTPDNSTSSTFAYDAMNRVTSVTHNFVGNTRTLNYAYDSVGRRKYLQRVGDAVGDDGFGYDLNNQITSFIRNGVLSGGTVTGGTSTTFNFDASGNRTTVVSGGTTTSYTPNFLNQYTAITGAGNPTYDNNGNLISYSAWTYIYDSMNRLSSATNGTTTAQFFYDGLNRQIGRSATGSTNHMSVMDGWNTYAEFDPGSTTPSERLVYAGDDLVQSPLLDRYYYPDALGSTAYVAGVSGGLLEGYSYDLYGAPTFYDASGNPRSPNTSSYNITRLFTGQQWHAQIGLYNLRNRFLKPDIGRFLQPDPIGFAGDPANLYRYVGNNPVNLSDPTGTDAVPHDGYYSYDVPGGPDYFGSLIAGRYRAYRPNGRPYQCAGTAQILGGGYGSDGRFYDVPDTHYWFQGASLDSGLDTGTIVARGWTDQGRYPNDQVNHTLWVDHYDSQGNAYLDSATKDTPIQQTMVPREDQWQYNEADVAAGDGPLGPVSQGDVIGIDPNTRKPVFFARAVAATPNTFYLNNGLWGNWGNPLYQAGSALSQYVPKRWETKKGH